MSSSLVYKVLGLITGVLVFYLTVLQPSIRLMASMFRYVFFVYNPCVHLRNYIYRLAKEVDSWSLEPAKREPEQWDWPDYLEDFKEMLPTNWAGSGTIAVVLSLVGLYMLRKSCLRTVLRIRGVELESAQPGSTLVKGPMPDFQVRLMRPGVLVDTHVGHGIRVGDHLVVPLHVLTDCGPMVIISGKSGKVLLENVSYVASRVVADLAYVLIPASSWAKLGTISAQLRTETKFPMVHCSGMGMISSGLMQPSNVLGMVSYFGSTIPGMSGAAYHLCNAVFGLHVGAVINSNMGVSAVVMKQELRYLCTQETKERKGMVIDPDSPGFAASHAKAGVSRPQLRWDPIRIGEMVATNWSDNDWVTGVDLDYDAKLDFGEESSKPSVVINVPEARTYTKHNPGGGEALIVDWNNERDVTSEIMDRLTALEEAVMELQTISKEDRSKRVLCPECPRSFSTVTGYEAHFRQLHVNAPRAYTTCTRCKKTLRASNVESHKVKCDGVGPRIVPESFDRSDPQEKPADVATAATKPVFRPPLRTPIGKSSKPFSNLPKPQAQSQLQKESQPPISELARTLEKCLSLLRQVTTGQQQVATPN